jgi:hypothetical protein
MGVIIFVYVAAQLLPIPSLQYFSSERFLEIENSIYWLTSSLSKEAVTGVHFVANSISLGAVSGTGTGENAG